MNQLVPFEIILTNVQRSEKLLVAAPSMVSDPSGSNIMLFAACSFLKPRTMLVQVAAAGSPIVTSPPAVETRYKDAVPIETLPDDEMALPT